MLEIAEVAALVAVALQLGCIFKALTALRVEISSARWEWNKRLGLPEQGHDGPQPLQGLRTDRLN